MQQIEGMLGECLAAMAATPGIFNDGEKKFLDTALEYYEIKRRLSVDDMFKLKQLWKRTNGPTTPRPAA